MNLALIGYGAMGKEIERVAADRWHAVGSAFDVNTPPTIDTLDGDVAIDFSNASAVEANVRACAGKGMNMVVGTTGWNAQKGLIQSIVEEHNIGLVYGSNFSVGMQMFFRIIERASQLVNSATEYDVLIHELHHHNKADSPSGTALSLADVVIRNLERKTSVLAETSHGKIATDVLHVTSSRVGEFSGTHTVYLDSPSDTIELTHRAKNRSGFALGAVIAAEWIKERKGFYDFTAIFEDAVKNI